MANRVDNVSSVDVASFAGTILRYAKHTDFTAAVTAALKDHKLRLVPDAD
jgi:hypothetical protein